MDSILARSGCVYLRRLASTRMIFLHTCFRPGFRHRFFFLLEWFWTPTWAYVGSFLANFSVLSWGLNLKSIFYRFFIDFWPPWHLKNWTPAYTRIKFSCFYNSYFKLPFGLRFGTQNLSKIEPKMLQNPFRYGVKILINLDVDFDRNLPPTWAPTWVSKKGPRLDFLELNIFFRWWNLGPAVHRAILGPKALWDRFLIDFWSNFDRFLIDFWTIFDRSWTLVLILDWVVDWMSCLNWLV